MKHVNGTRRIWDGGMGGEGNGPLSCSSCGQLGGGASWWGGWHRGAVSSIRELSHWSIKN